MCPESAASASWAMLALLPLLLVAGEAWGQGDGSSRGQAACPAAGCPNCATAFMRVHCIHWCRYACILRRTWPAPSGIVTRPRLFPGARASFRIRADDAIRRSTLISRPEEEASDQRRSFVVRPFRSGFSVRGRVDDMSRRLVKGRNRDGAPEEASADEDESVERPSGLISGRTVLRSLRSRQSAASLEPVRPEIVRPPLRGPARRLLSKERVRPDAVDPGRALLLRSRTLASSGAASEGASSSFEDVSLDGDKEEEKEEEVRATGQIQKPILEKPRSSVSRTRRDRWRTWRPRPTSTPLPPSPASSEETSSPEDYNDYDYDYVSDYLDQVKFDPHSTTVLPSTSPAPTANATSDVVCLLHVKVLGVSFWLGPVLIMTKITAGPSV